MSPTSYIKQLFRTYTREFRMIFSDGGMILFFLFLPLAYPIVYSLIYNPEVVRRVAIVVVDEDGTSESRDLVHRLSASQYVYVKGYAADLSEGKRAMNSHNCYGILEIPEGFGRKMGRGETADAVIYCEMSLLLRYKALLMATTDVMQDMGANLQVADLMPIESVAMGNIESGFCSFVMPGVVVLILQQCILLAVGMAGGARRENPLLTGYIAYNEQPSPLMTILGKTLCYITIMLIPIIFLTHYVPLIFRFPMADSYWQIAVFLLPLVLSSIFLGFMLQSLIWDREEIILVWVVSSLFFLFVSGLTWPRFAMSPFWHALGDICPATWGVEGFIQMNANGSSLSQVWEQYRNMWILTGVYFVGAYAVQVLMRKAEKRRLYRDV